MPKTRREFILGMAGIGLSGLRSPAGEAEWSIRALTSGPKHHFFGYYGIPPWNLSGKHLVCLESAFQDHMPLPTEPAQIGLVDPERGGFSPIAQTHAWNFQQGAMLHWNPLRPETEIIHNDRKKGEILAVIRDVTTGKTRELPRPVSAVAATGKYALSLTYGRLTRLRPVVGYPGLQDPNPNSPHPDNDGVFRLDLTSGEAKLTVSIRQVFEILVKDQPDLKDRHMWFNHTVINRDATRFLFLARAWSTGTPRRLESAMFTANLDGTELRRVIPFQPSVSHFDWRTPTEIIATFPFQGRQMKHVLFTNGKEDYRVVGDSFFKGDGHCHFSPDGQWLVSDPPDSEIGGRNLLLLNMKTGEGAKLGAFPLKEYLSGDLRCDLHPRWSRSGDAICFDALEPQDWTRQLHLARWKR